MDKEASNPAKIKYCSVGDGSLKEIEDLMTWSFAKDENFEKLCQNCEGGQPEGHRPWIEKTVRAHDWSISRLAVDAATGAVAGVCLCDVGTAEKRSQALQCIAQTNTEASRLLSDYIKEMAQGYDEFGDPAVKKAMYLNFVTIDKRYRRQGISLELRRQSLELARQHGCQVVVDVATSPFTRKVLTKLGFQQIMFQPFTESLLTNVEKVDLSGCGPEDGGALMVCHL